MVLIGLLEPGLLRTVCVERGLTNLVPGRGRGWGGGGAPSRGVGLEPKPKEVADGE